MNLIPFLLASNFDLQLFAAQGLAFEKHPRRGAGALVSSLFPLGRVDPCLA
jgi:hypothetical protein